MDEERRHARSMTPSPRAPCGTRMYLGHALATCASIFAVVCRNADHALKLSAETMEFAATHDLEMWKVIWLDPERVRFYQA